MERLSGAACERYMSVRARGVFCGVCVYSLCVCVCVCECACISGIIIYQCVSRVVCVCVCLCVCVCV